MGGRRRVLPTRVGVNDTGLHQLHHDTSRRRPGRSGATPPSSPAACESSAARCALFVSLPQRRGRRSSMSSRRRQRHLAQRRQAHSLARGNRQRHGYSARRTVPQSWSPSRLLLSKAAIPRRLHAARLACQTAFCSAALSMHSRPRLAMARPRWRLLIAEAIAARDRRDAFAGSRTRWTKAT